ncbi:MAG TPA: cupin domain-containing protein [Trebonia sp.]|nr:cupin domain-containing protein [Trebonia sp.]
MTCEAFRAQYWERDVLFLQRQAAGFFADLMTLDDLDRILSASGCYESEVSVTVNGHTQAVPDDYLRLETIYAYYRRGATIGVNFIHRRWEPLAQLCRSMSHEISAPLNVNAYLTPAGSQGFGTHFDTHDVFVLQIHGAKLWRLYEPSHRLPEGAEPAGEHDSPPGPVKSTAELRAGDLLYLPKGTPHDATANESASLHLTIGVHPVTWASVAREALNEIISRDARYREALPMGFAADQAVATSSYRHLADLMTDLAGQLPATGVVEAAAQQVRAITVPPLRGHLLDLESLDSLDLGSTVCQRPSLVWATRDSGEVIELEFNGKVLGFPARIRPQLLFATQNLAFTGHDLPGGLDEPGRLGLVSTLVREGFLTLA